MNKLDHDIQHAAAWLDKPAQQANSKSAQPCGCDAGADYLCQWHYDEAHPGNKGVDQEADVNDFAQPYEWALTGAAAAAFTAAAEAAEEVRIVDPVTGGQKGSKLQRFSLIPAEFLWALAEHYGLGARKYDDRNWERGYKWSLSQDAHDRHLNTWLRGEDCDPETGTNHLIAAAWHLVALFIFQLRGLGTDDIRRGK
jgi:hypothetical protein